uniref:Uncharacterized protein n=1 Tax=Knipowitschia caucasica TaxID=637954 RepID=A0AAV2L5T0_KNICA
MHTDLLNPEKKCHVLVPIHDSNIFLHCLHKNTTCRCEPCYPATTHKLQVVHQFFKKEERRGGSTDLCPDKV